MELSKDRIDILKKVEEYERLGLFDRDVENDPPTRPLHAGEVDYIGNKASTRFFTKIANIIGQNHFEKALKRGDFVIEDIRGIENFRAVADKGVLITCNHFSVYDNYAVYKTLEPELDGKMLYKIIREGNYTSFKGLYGFLFRHCNTLPLSSSLSCMKELMSATDTLFKRGEKILIYPEQAMWYNYKKPRPLKKGAFRIAARSKVDILPIFITHTDTDRIGSDGYYAQSYTVHILPPIFYDAEKSVSENTDLACKKNYELWKECYEGFYKTKLEYTTEGGADPCST